MKRFIFTLASILILLAAFPAALTQEGQKACEFNIVGMWQSTTGGHASPTRLRFDKNGTATVLSRNTSGQGPEWQAGESSNFKLDNPKAPKAIHLWPKG